MTLASSRAVRRLCTSAKMASTRSALDAVVASRFLRAAAALSVLGMGYGCAQFAEQGLSGPDAAKLTQARESYVRCIDAEAEKDAGNPAGAEDIAVAAHARCWSSWDAYRATTNATYSSGARTRDERQLAHDKADAHLRQFELDTRKTVVERIVERTLKRKP